MGSKRQLVEDHAAQPNGKKRKKVEALTAAVKDAISEVSAKLKKKKKLKAIAAVASETGFAPSLVKQDAAAATTDPKPLKKAKKAKRADGSAAAETAPLQPSDRERNGAGTKARKNKKRKLLACVAAPVTAADADGEEAAASPAKKRKKGKKQKQLAAAEPSTAGAPPQTDSVPVLATNGNIANGAPAAMAGDGSAGVPAKMKKKKKRKDGNTEAGAAAPLADPLAVPDSVQPVAEALPAAAEQREKPEPELEAAVPDPEPLKGDEDQQRGVQRQQQQGAPGSGRAFQRVKAEEWLDKKAARDNSYVGTFGEAGYGIKAQQVLGQVRGKDFRHEKTKKKRGSYRGGIIDHSTVNSFKFESDDE